MVLNHSRILAVCGPYIGRMWAIYKYVGRIWADHRPYIGRMKAVNMP